MTEAAGPATGASSDVSVVIASRNRGETLLATLDRLSALPERPPLIFVDNGSTDGSPAAVRSRFPQVVVVELGRNRGASARNVGAERATTELVAFSDDDSWWDPGALPLAGRLFAEHRRMALLAARILVGPDGRLDPTCTAMETSCLPRQPDLPGPSVLGFVACGTVVRRDAFLAVGGFDEVVFFRGEEERVAIDLTVAGWGLAYVDAVVARHHPSPAGSTAQQRRRLQLRNYLLSQWMRRPAKAALGRTLAVTLDAARDPVARGALVDAFRRMPLAMRERRPVPPDVEALIRQLEGAASRP